MALMAPAQQHGPAQGMALMALFQVQCPAFALMPALEQDRAGALTSALMQDLATALEQDRAGALTSALVTAPMPAQMRYLTPAPVQNLAYCLPLPRLDQPRVFA
jgi:hypothetical protein